MLHEGLVLKISTGGASPLRGAGSWRSYSHNELSVRSKNNYLLESKYITSLFHSASVCIKPTPLPFGCFCHLTKQQCGVHGVIVSLQLSTSVQLWCDMSLVTTIVEQGMVNYLVR